MSEVTAPSNRPLHVAAYILVGLAVAFELAVVWFMLHPQVPPDYRAYYIDQTTTCLNQPVSGQYTLGTTVSFVSDGLENARPLRVCGWEGPAGDGTHSVGRTSRLRFAVPPGTSQPLALHLDLVAVQREGHPSQRIALEANGIALGTVTAQAGIPLGIDLTVPLEALTGHSGTLELALHYADAIRMSPTDSDTRMRAIKLLSARLEPAQ